MREAGRTTSLLEGGDDEAWVDAVGADLKGRKVDRSALGEHVDGSLRCAVCEYVSSNERNLINEHG